MQRPKILIVDDRFENLVALEKLLADLPARTVRANSGNEALALTLEHDFALVLLDVQMPVMDGFEVARLLHESFKTRHLPIIFLSAVYSGDVFKIKGVESGAVDFIEKPIIPELLLGKVRLFLELHEYRKQLIDLSSRDIVAQISDGMLIVNRDAEILLANPAAEKLLGKEASQLVGSHFDYPLIPKELQEIAIPTASASKLTVELNVSSMQWSGENVYIISMRDITYRKLTEKALQDSEAKLNSILRSAPIGIGQVSNREINFVNESFAQMLGYSVQELIGNNSRIVYPSDEEFERVGRYKYEEIKTKGTGSMETVMQKKDGTLIDVFLSSTPVNQDDLSQGVTFSALDITERTRGEEQRLELEVQLRQKFKMEAVGVMAGGMAHNFNNNLSIILGNLELVNMQKTLTAEAQEFLKNAKIGVLRSRDLIQQIMAYSRSEKQKLIPIQLAPVINETLNLLRSMIPTTVSLQYNSTPESLETTVLADATRVQEALLNLCNNAVHAMDETGLLTIDLDTVALQGADMLAEYSECLPGNFVRLRVQDSGCGMTDELLTQIFDPFYTTKGVGEGTGMGLSTVQGMIKQIGGQIKVSSTCGQGTIFNLYFPTIEATHTEEATAENTTLPRGSERILFVDDDEMLASLGEQLLTGLGYQVSIMTESTEALKMFAVNFEHFNLVITDQTMPQLSGKDLIQELKKIKPDIPTILCTGYSSKVNEDNAKELGISAFLMKPLDLPKLAQTVRRVLDGEE